MEWFLILVAAISLNNAFADIYLPCSIAYNLESHKRKTIFASFIRFVGEEMDVGHSITEKSHGSGAKAIRSGKRVLDRLILVG